MSLPNSLMNRAISSSKWSIISYYTINEETMFISEDLMEIWPEKSKRLDPTFVQWYNASVIFFKWTSSTIVDVKADRHSFIVIVDFTKVFSRKSKYFSFKHSCLTDIVLVMNKNVLPNSNQRIYTFEFSKILGIR